MPYIIQRESGVYYAGGAISEVVTDENGVALYDEAGRVRRQPYGWTTDPNRARIYKRQCDVSNSIRVRRLRYLSSRDGNPPERINLRVVPVQIIPQHEIPFS